MKFWNAIPFGTSWTDASVLSLSALAATVSHFGTGKERKRLENLTILRIQHVTRRDIN